MELKSDANIIINHYFFVVLMWTVNSCLLLISDIDECSENTGICVDNANCTNTDGSFICQCGFGFVGDGRSTGTGCNGNKDCNDLVQ